MDDCLFCKVAQNNVPSYKVYEDENIVAFLDIFPSTPGHVVIISKKHGWSILDYTPDELNFFWPAIQRVMTALTKVFHTEIFTIGSNHKELKGVHHFHMHILPRFSDDKGGVIQSLVEKEGKDSLPDIAKKIQQACK